MDLQFCVEYDECAMNDEGCVVKHPSYRIDVCMLRNLFYLLATTGLLVVRSIWADNVT